MLLASCSKLLRSSASQSCSFRHVSQLSRWNGNRVCYAFRPKCNHHSSERRLLTCVTRDSSCNIQTCRHFHLSSRRYLPPMFWVIFKPLARVASIITGRYFRKWWQKLPESEKFNFWNKLHLSRHKMSLGLVLLLACGIVYYTSHLQQVPLTGRKRFIAFTPEQFQKIVSFELEQQLEIVKNNVVSLSHPIYKQIVNIVQNIVNSNQDVDFLRQQSWTVIVVDSEEENAFVLPTGHIFVFTGLLKSVDNNDQLAVILGHEMAHAVLGHSAEQVSMVQFLDLYIIVVMAAIWAIMPTDGIALVTQWFYNKVVQLVLRLPYSRRLEAEADQIGLRLIAKACYDVRESSYFWSTMALRSDLPGADGEVPQWLSTHPSHEKRAQYLDELIPLAIEMRETCKCPSLPLPDPRNRLKFLEKINSESQQTATPAKGA